MRNWIAASVPVARLVTAESDGQDLLEYSILASLIAMVVIGSLSLVGHQIDVLWDMIAAADFMRG